MQEIRSYLLSVAVTLIFTGIIGRLVPENSNKSLIRFVITTIVLVSIFGISVNPESFSEITDFTTETYFREDIENEISSAVYEKICEEFNKEINKIVSDYCPSANTSVSFADNSMTVTICYNDDMNLSDKQIIENEIRSSFEGKIVFEYRAVTE